MKETPNRIIVVGTTGSGKSTLARALAAKINAPYVQLDALYWKANWTGSSNEEFFQKIKSTTHQEQWVVDGNFKRSWHIHWPKAEMVIWLDLPFWLTCYQNVSRSIQRAIKRNELWEETGNRESFLRMFTKDSIVLWLFKTYRSNVQRYEKIMVDPKYAHLKIIRLKSRRAMRDFLRQLPIN